ncbi:MAG: hypothetical protein BGO67_11825 [Alphaproteobacteria bacterium 41-28]|nr:MAG: hypothetical protein BGO67_11825 [Alphaproteobacteria bacterium 41-28]
MKNSFLIMISMMGLLSHPVLSMEERENPPGVSKNQRKELPPQTEEAKKRTPVQTFLGLPKELWEHIFSLLFTPETYETKKAIGAFFLVDKATSAFMTNLLSDVHFLWSYTKDAPLEEREEKDESFAFKQATTLFGILKKAGGLHSQNEDVKAVNTYLDALEVGSLLSGSRLIVCRMEKIIDSSRWRGYIGEERFSLATLKIKTTLYSLLHDMDQDQARGYGPNSQKDEALFSLYFKLLMLSPERRRFEKIAPLEVRIDQAKNEGLENQGENIESPPHLLRMIAQLSTSDLLSLHPEKMFQMPEIQINKLFELAAERGDAETQYELGNDYKFKADSMKARDSEFTKNLEFTKIIDKATEWLTKSAEKGFIKAQLDLGWYYKSEATNQDLPKAIYWLTRAAEQGNPEAQFLLGDIYHYEKEKLQLTIPWHIKAIHWYSRAAKHNNEDAQKGLACLKNEGFDVP